MDYTELNSFILTHHRLVHRITVWTCWRVLNQKAIKKMLELADGGQIKLEKDFLDDNEYLWELYIKIYDNPDKFNDLTYTAKIINELNIKYGNIYHMD